MRPILASLSTALVVVLSACSGDSQPMEEQVEARVKDIKRVSIALPEGSPEPFYLSSGEQVALTVKANNSSSQEVELSAAGRRWLLSDPGVAQVNARGQLEGALEGQTTVVMRYADLQSQAITVTVSNATLADVAEIAGDETLAPCVASSYQAIGRYSDGSSRLLNDVEWSSEGEGAGRPVSAANNSVELSASDPGQITLEAKSGFLSLTRTLTVADSLVSLVAVPANPRVGEGQTLALTVNGEYTATDSDTNTTRDITGALTWTVTSGEDVATVSSAGVVTGVTQGTAVVQAACGEAQRLAVVVEVTRGNVGNSSALAFSVGGPLYLEDNGSGQQIRIATGSSYAAEDDITADATWSIAGASGVVSLSGTGSNVVTIVPESIGSTVVRASYEGDTEDILVYVQ